MIRVLVWAKSAIGRSGLAHLVSADPRLQLVQETRTSDLHAAIRESHPDVVLLDSSGEQDELPRFTFRAATTPFLVVLHDPERRDVRRLLGSGVRGIIADTAGPEEIVGAVQAVAAGLAAVSPEILDLLLPARETIQPEEQFVEDEPLTPRESEVLGLLAEGAGNKEIATRLRLSEHTVKFHVSSILSKLGAATRTEAVTRGYRKGLILM